MRHAITVAALFFLATLANAQDLTITARYVQASVSTTTTTSTTATIEGQPLVFDSSSTGTAPTPATAALIDVNTAASMVRLKCRTATVKKLESGNVWAIVMPGEHLVEATAVDFDLKIWDEAELRITIEGELPDPVDPDPVDPDPVDPIDPDPPIVVVDAYMVGQAAYDASRQYTPEQRATIADVYRRSAEFLYGRPVLKYIAGPDDPNLTNPDLSVFAWQTQQLMGQREFLEAMREPLITAQQTLNCTDDVCRGFARSDWYGAFQEIAEAVSK